MKAPLAVLLLLTASPVGAEPLGDPWALVSELPNACYWEDLDARITAAMEAVGAEQARLAKAGACTATSSRFATGRRLWYWGR